MLLFLFHSPPLKTWLTFYIGWGHNSNKQWVPRCSENKLELWKSELILCFYLTFISKLLVLICQCFVLMYSVLTFGSIKLKLTMINFGVATKLFRGWIDPRVSRIIQLVDRIRRFVSSGGQRMLFINSHMVEKITVAIIFAKHRFYFAVFFRNNVVIKYSFKVFHIR